jgi:hypothetical protein
MKIPSAEENVSNNHIFQKIHVQSCNGDEASLRKLEEYDKTRVLSQLPPNRIGSPSDAHDCIKQVN